MLNVTNTFFAFYLMVVVSFMQAQTNLVPNGSFETYTSCPNSSDQINRAIGWASFRESPDYFNTCSTISGIKPPYSAYGFQYPQDGNAYAGFATYDNTGLGPNMRELLGSKLTTTLNIGVKYYFSFYVNLAGGYNFTLATNKIGLRFSKVSYSYTNPAPINNLAHYYCTNKITDTLNWTKLQGSFTADSAYQYVMFGNFFNDANTDTLGIGPPPANQYGFYYIDNIRLSTDSTYAFETFISNMNNSPDVLLYPNPSSNILHIKSSIQPTEIEVLDLLGIKCYQIEIINSKAIDVNLLSDGIYIIKLKLNGSTITRKIIIKK